MRRRDRRGRYARRPHPGVAEDDKEKRDLIAFRLEQAGFSVRTCANGPAVIDALGTSDPAALVVEQRLPGLDGVQLCRLLRGNPVTADLPVLMVSDTPTEETLAAFAGGADDWLPEPAGIHDLQLRLGALLARCRRHPLTTTAPLRGYRPRHPARSRMLSMGTAITIPVNRGAADDSTATPPASHPAGLAAGPARTASRLDALREDLDNRSCHLLTNRRYAGVVEHQQTWPVSAANRTRGGPACPG
jgi:DNA-binding response OmpR family regulator